MLKHSGKATEPLMSAVTDLARACSAYANASNSDRSYVPLFTAEERLYAVISELNKTVDESTANNSLHKSLSKMQSSTNLALRLLESADVKSYTVRSAFREAGAQLAIVVNFLTNSDPILLVRETIYLLDADNVGITDDFLIAVYPVLGLNGQKEFRSLLQERLAKARSKPDGSVSGYRGNLWAVLLELIEADYDLDTFIIKAETDGRLGMFASAIARRLIIQHRPLEALVWLDRAPNIYMGDESLHNSLRITALDALGRREEAQKLRWEESRRRLGLDDRKSYSSRLLDYY